MRRGKGIRERRKERDRVQKEREGKKGERRGVRGGKGNKTKEDKRKGEDIRGL